MSDQATSSPFKGFHHLTSDQRCAKLVEAGVLSQKQADYLRQAVSADMDVLCQQFSENGLSGFALPYGVVPDLVINDKTYVVPLAVEETSIVAGLCKMAKWIRQSGRIKTSQSNNCIMGQVYFPEVNDTDAFCKTLAKTKAELMQQLNEEVVPGMVKRGGGVKDFRIRILEQTDNASSTVIDVFLDACDAMGANLITQVCEWLKSAIQTLTGIQPLMGIVSNYPAHAFTKATITIHDVGADLGKRLEQASRFAEMDPHRAATSNKGVMNGIDAVLIATGNDWRAVEAGVHTHAARGGHYTTLTQWRYKDGTLTGVLEAPIQVGTVGGVTKLHPLAQISLAMLKIEKASQLSQIIAAVGLLQNLAALMALVGEGIAQGHMRLHIDNLMLQLGVVEKDRQIVKTALIDYLQKQGRLTLSDAKAVYETMRRST